MGSRTASFVIALALLGQVVVPSQCELFTALAHMEGLLTLEVELLASLNSYIVAEKERLVIPYSHTQLPDPLWLCIRLKELEDFSSRVSEAHSLYSGHPAATHLHDPVNAFQLVNRYFNKWMHLQDNVYTDNSKGETSLQVILS
jgi:prolyl 4-hydroxylase